MNVPGNTVQSVGVKISGGISENNKVATFPLPKKEKIYFPKINCNLKISEL